jgi:hypothetical protein
MTNKRDMSPSVQTAAHVCRFLPTSAYIDLFGVVADLLFWCSSGSTRDPAYPARRHGIILALNTETLPKHPTSASLLIEVVLMLRQGNTTQSSNSVYNLNAGVSLSIQITHLPSVYTSPRVRSAAHLWSCRATPHTPRNMSPEHQECFTQIKASRRS